MAGATGNAAAVTDGEDVIALDAWRPADERAGLERIEHMSVIELVAMDLADLADVPVGAGVTVSLPWTDAVLAEMVAAGGVIERAFSTEGYYAHVSVSRGEIRFYSVGPKYYGPRTLEEERSTISWVRGERAAAVKADERWEGVEVVQ